MEIMKMKISLCFVEIATSLCIKAALELTLFLKETGYAIIATYLVTGKDCW
jgi:hypothetical protein